MIDPSVPDVGGLNCGAKLRFLFEEMIARGAFLFLFHGCLRQSSVLLAFFVYYRSLLSPKYYHHLSAIFYWDAETSVKSFEMGITFFLCRIELSIVYMGKFPGIGHLD